MAYKEVSRMEIAEVIRRWQSGISLRYIASGTGLSRDTVRRYVAAAKEEGLSLSGPAPSEEQISRLAAIGRSGPRAVATPAEDLLAPWGDQIYQWLTVDHLQLTRILELLLDRGCEVSYTSLRRFLQRRNWRRRNPATVRMEDTAPGEVAELDFGRLGLVHDPESGPPAHRVGASAGTELFQALFSLAHLQPEAGGRHSRAGIGLGLLRRHSQIPGDGQFPRRSCRSGLPAPKAHAQLPGIFPAPRLPS